MFGRDNIDIQCFCNKWLTLPRLNGYMKCGHCGAQHTTGPGGTKVSNTGPQGYLVPVNEPISVPLFEAKFSEGDINDFANALHEGHILPEDF